MNIRTTEDMDTVITWMKEASGRCLEGALHFRVEQSYGNTKTIYFLSVFDPRKTETDLSCNTEKVLRNAKDVLSEGVVSHIAYTDGGCWPNPGGPGGVGVVLLGDGTREERSVSIGTSTNNEAELMAVREALLMIPNRRRSKLIVMSDSTYAIGVLYGRWKANAHKELIREIRTLSKECVSFKMCHVYAHSGVVENEAADRLAKDAINRAPEIAVELWED